VSAAAAGGFRAACVQLSAGPETAANVAAASDAVRRARDQGADVVLTPEATALLETDRRRLFEKLEAEADNRALEALRAAASETGAWLVVGSLLIRLDQATAANRCYVIDPSGRVAARYDKIHMFDVDIPDGQRYRESSAYRPGGEAVTVDLPWARLGLTICYDVRFPALYRALAQAGAQALTVPSAFTRYTGQAHWHVLLRARAVETGCYVLAPAQCGEHAGGRQTYGHSLIVDPWGTIVAEAGEEPAVIVADLDMEQVAEARRKVPSLSGDRPFRSPDRPGSPG
jgi:predicted amidohydrolase